MWFPGLTTGLLLSLLATAGSAQVVLEPSRDTGQLLDTASPFLVGDFNEDEHLDLVSAHGFVTPVIEVLAGPRRPASAPACRRSGRPP